MKKQKEKPKFHKEQDGVNFCRECSRKLNGRIYHGVFCFNCSKKIFL